MGNEPFLLSLEAYTQLRPNFCIDMTTDLNIWKEWGLNGTQSTTILANETY